MSKNPGEYSMKGESREMTVLFSDVRDFTSISEGLTPEGLKDLMNTYLTAMTEKVQVKRGTRELMTAAQIQRHLLACIEPRVGWAGFPDWAGEVCAAWKQALDLVEMQAIDESRAFDWPLKFALFRREIARARTFGFMKDVAKLWGAGYALGASFENTLVVTEDRVLNPEGLRFADEFVRHKILDAIGDLALAGQPLLAAYRTVRGGHKLNHAVLSALMADPSAWRVVEAAEPVRRTRGHAAVATGLVAPAFGPEVS